MKTLSLIILMIMSVSVSAQVEIQLDKMFNGLAFFSIVQEEDRNRVEKGETLYVWGWTSEQMDTMDDGVIFIKGYNSNFVFTSVSDFRSGRFWQLPLDKPCFVWASFDQPFGHRPPPFLHLAVNKVEFKNDHYDMRYQLEAIIDQQETSERSLLENLNITIAPNPTTTQVNVKFDKDYGKTSVVIINSIGKIEYAEQMDQTDVLSIPAEGFARGVYFLHVESEGYRSVKKVLLL